MITTALKQNAANPEALAAATAAMTTLNRAASIALQEFQKNSKTKNPIHAVTDVTGFSLLGHAREVSLGDPANNVDPVSLEIDHSAFEYFPGAIDCARAGHLSGGLKNNRAFIGDCVAFAPGMSPEFQDLLFDPQTSGGLLAAIAPESADAALAALHRRNVSGHIVGEVTARRSPLLEVV